MSGQQSGAASAKDIRISFADFDGQLEWAIDIDGVLWAAGDSVSVEDGERQARACLAEAGIAVSQGAAR